MYVRGKCITRFLLGGSDRGRGRRQLGQQPIPQRAAARATRAVLVLVRVALRWGRRVALLGGRWSGCLAVIAILGVCTFYVRGSVSGGAERAQGVQGVQAQGCEGERGNGVDGGVRPSDGAGEQHVFETENEGRRWDGRHC